MTCTESVLLAGDKEPVRLASTANLSLAGLLTVDGVVTVAGDRILVKNQTDAKSNGIYIASENVWRRAMDFETSRMMIAGMKVTVQEGEVHSDEIWSLVINRPNLGTDPITFELFTAGGAVDTVFQQDGAGTVPLTIVQVLKEWHTLQMYGGGTDKTAAQNAAAFVAARNKLRTGGTLIVPRGMYTCDPVAFTVPDGGYTSGLNIEGVGNPGGAANPNSVIIFSGGGAGKFWDFDNPAGASSGGARMSVKNLFFYASNPAFNGTLISSTTPVTDGSKLTDHFTLENCTLQAGTAAGTTLLDIGKTIITSIINNRFGGGACQIKGQQGLTPAGIAQARQSTTVDLRKNTFIGCDGYPILYGGEGWGCYDNVFEASAGGRMRCFATNGNYPIRNMTWINNWCGDTTANPVGDQAFVFFGQGLVFMGNYVSGIYTGGGGQNSNGFNAVSLEAGFKSFNVSANTFEYCSAAIGSAGASVNYGVIEGNVINLGAITTGAFGASVRIAGNGI